MTGYFNVFDFVIATIVGYGFLELFHKFFDCFRQGEKKYPISYDLVIFLISLFCAITLLILREVFR